MRLHIDIETYSPEPLGDCGLYRYAMHPDFEILLFAYAIDDQPVQIIDLAMGEALSAWIISALTRPDVLKVAHNAAFERTCLAAHLWQTGSRQRGSFLDPHGWRCTMAQATECGLPASLDAAGRELGLVEQKMKEGKNLIKVFCTPHKDPGGLYSQTMRISPEERPEDWFTFKEYCKRDVEVEREIDRRTEWVVEADRSHLRKLYETDQRINDRGVLADVAMAGEAVRMDAVIKARLTKEAATITGLSNPNSVAQLKDWIASRTGESLDRLRKEDIADLSGSTDDSDVRRVLQIRAEMGKTSCAKYAKILATAGEDDRVRGMLMYYGTRTGRWAGRFIQPQNLPQNHLESLDFARDLLRSGDLDSLELCYGNVPSVMSQLIRTVLVAPEGRTFAVCDFSAIEARVLAWLAGEDWVLDVFRKGGDIYCATASQMFHVPVEKHGPNAGLRQKGKIAVLALGYGGGIRALEAMGGARLGMTEEEMQDTVDKWRAANPRICQLWRDVDRAVRQCVTYRTQHAVGRLLFSMHGDTLVIDLPSGRPICYDKACIKSEAGGKDSIAYRGMLSESKTWGWVRTFGGKLVENITQAVARDCLGEVMLRLDRHAHYMPIVFHVHDEVIVETEEPAGALDLLEEAFSQSAPWNEDLPLRGAGYVTPYYKKD